MANNKYRRWYDALMQRAVGRVLDGYGERHHVVPRALGGGNTASNIVALTYREHFLAHWLLPKFTAGVDRRKMLHALFRMSGQFGGRVVPSWRYEISRRAQRDAKLGTKQSAATVAKRSASLRGNKNGLGVKLTSDQIDCRRKRLRGNKHSLGYRHTEATLRKRGAATKSSWANYTEEQRQARVSKMKLGFARLQASKERPWQDMGMSRSTWYRKGRPVRSATVPSNG
jgi:hypothetical protein